MEPVLNKTNKNIVPTVIWNGSNLSLFNLGQESQTTMQHFSTSFPQNLKNCSLKEESAYKNFLFEKNDSVKNVSLNNGSKNPVSKIPDGGWGWVVVFSSFIISMIADGVSFSFGLLYVEFLDYFQQSKSKTSWIGSLFMSVPLLSGPIMSALVDRYGCRKMTILGGLISGIGFVVASFGGSIEFELVFFGLVAGLGLGLCYVTAVVSIAYWFDKYRTLAIGLGSCGTGVGTFVYAPLTQFLIEEYGWRGGVLLLAGTFLNLCLCGTVMREPKWLAFQQVKDNQLKSMKNISLGGATSYVDGFSFKGIKTETPESTMTTTEAGECDKHRRLPITRSLINLPTFMRQNEKVSLEVLKHLNHNLTIKNVNINFENPPSLLHSRSTSIEEKLNNSPQENKPLAISMPMKLKRSMKKETLDLSRIIENSSSELDQNLMHIESAHIVNPERKESFEKKHTICKESQNSYLRDIRLQRNSVTYRGAIMNIPRYRLRASSCPNILRNSTKTIAKESEEKQYADAVELLKAMFDFSMFLELHFVLMSVATILLFTWFIVPYFYLAEHLSCHGYTEVDSSFLLSAMGVANCLGMIGLGWAGDQPWMNVTMTYAACLALCGISCISMPLLTYHYNILVVACALFGLFFASNYSFTPSILVQLIPLEKFTTAYGLILLCQGIGNLIGPPLAGLIFDLTGQWDLSFYMAGAWILISGILTILIQFTNNRKLRKPVDKKNRNTCKQGL